VLLRADFLDLCLRVERSVVAPFASLLLPVAVAPLAPESLVPMPLLPALCAPARLADNASATPAAIAIRLMLEAPYDVDRITHVAS
jgi:hypothetical protein